MKFIWEQHGKPLKEPKEQRVKQLTWSTGAGLSPACQLLGTAPEQWSQHQSWQTCVHAEKLNTCEFVFACSYMAIIKNCIHVNTHMNAITGLGNCEWKN